MPEQPIPTIPLVEEPIDWERKCEIARDAIVRLTRIKKLLDAIPLDYKPDDDN